MKWIKNDLVASLVKINGHKLSIARGASIDNTTWVPDELLMCAIRWIWKNTDERCAYRLTKSWLNPIKTVDVYRRATPSVACGMGNLTIRIVTNWQPRTRPTYRNVFHLVCALAYAMRPSLHNRGTRNPMDMYRVPEARAFKKHHKRLMKAWLSKTTKPKGAKCTS